MTRPDAPSRGYRTAVTIREIVLWIGSAVGVLCLIVAGAALFFGITPLVFRSGSMSPQIPTGALALARTTSAADLHPGDVVSVIRADGERVTHRLVSDKPAGNGLYSLVVKGDANAEPDPEPVVTRSVDRVFWSTPELGYVLQTGSKPQVLLPIGALFGILAVIGFRPPLDKRLLRDPADEMFATDSDDEHDAHDVPDVPDVPDENNEHIEHDSETQKSQQDHAESPPRVDPPSRGGHPATPRHRGAEDPSWTTDALTSAYDARRLSSVAVAPSPDGPPAP